MRGKVLWFNEAKDHGFIMTDEGERLAVRGTGFAGGKRPEGRCAESPVTFDIDDSNGTREAQSVVFDEDDAPRRPRLRGGRGVRR